MVSAGWLAAGQQLPHLARALNLGLDRRLQTAWQRCDELQRRLLHPRTRLARSQERWENLAHRLRRAGMQQLQTRHLHLQGLAPRLHNARPDTGSLAQRLEQIQARLQLRQQQKLQRWQERLDELGSHLEHLNPDAVLRRGYAVVRDAQGRIVRQATTQAEGEALDIRLAEGELRVIVTKA